MDAQFWINAWNEGRTNFHRSTYHEKLLEYFPQLNPEKGQSVLVPLCGKTKDLLWLSSEGLNVHGVELYQDPVEAFFQENNLSPVEVSATEHFKNYSYKNILLSCGNFFDLNQENAYDLIYDRASLVALPSEMRKTYAEVITKALKPGGKYLLIVYEYDQTKMDGPPFSVTEKEVHELYEKHFSIKQMESMKPETDGSRFADMASMRQNVYFLQKKN